MYEVFINNRSLIIAEKQADLNPQNLIFSHPFDWIKLINELYEGSLDICCVYAQDCSAAWLDLQNSLTTIYAAGGLVSRDKKYLFIYRNSKWDLPKGKLESNESIEECAVREVQEECGITQLKIVKKLLKTYHIYEHKEVKTLKITQWYLMHCKDHTNLVPQKEEGIEKVVWKDEQEIKLALKNTYANIRRLIENVNEI